MTEKLSREPYGDNDVPTTEVAAPHDTAERQENINRITYRALETSLNVGGKEQLANMAYFWDTLGYKMPELSWPQQLSVEKSAHDNPTLRLVPSPLLGGPTRRQLIERAGALRHTSDDRTSTLHVRRSANDSLLQFTDLAENLDGGVEYNGLHFAMHYKTPSGRVARRAEFIHELRDARALVVSHDSVPWIFPMVDVSTNPPLTHSTLPSSYRKIDPLLTTETLLALQLMYHTQEKELEFRGQLCNEALFLLDKSTGSVKPYATFGSLNPFPPANELRPAGVVTIDALPTTGAVDMALVSLEDLESPMQILRRDPVAVREAFDALAFYR